MDDLPGPEPLLRGVRRLLIVEERARRELRRQRFVLRARAEAARVGAGLDVRVHPGATIGSGARVDLWPGRRNRLVVGDGTRIGDGVSVSLRGGELTIGAGTDVRRFVTVTCAGRLTIGDEAVVSTGVHLHCTQHLEIGSWTIVGEYSTLADSDHVRTTADSARPPCDHHGAAARGAQRVDRGQGHHHEGGHRRRPGLRGGPHGRDRRRAGRMARRRDPRPCGASDRRRHADVATSCAAWSAARRPALRPDPMHAGMPTPS